jgi:hypothetical protein
MEYILGNFMLYVRANLKNVTTYLTMHSHSALIFRLLCISIADYRLSNFWLAKEVNKEVKKKLQHQCL